MNAASSGPSAEPTLPPTWNSDCARPCRPPDAMRATREDSGWNTDEPDADQRRGEQQRSESRRERQQQQPDQREAHADRERVRLRLLVGVEADQRLQQRGGELVGQRDQADLAEARARTSSFSIG